MKEIRVPDINYQEEIKKCKTSKLTRPRLLRKDAWAQTSFVNKCLL